VWIRIAVAACTCTGAVELHALRPLVQCARAYCLRYYSTSTAAQSPRQCSTSDIVNAFNNRSYEREMTLVVALRIGQGAPSPDKGIQPIALNSWTCSFILWGLPPILGFEKKYQLPTSSVELALSLQPATTQDGLSL
jgi:hypothetical protein